MKKLKKRMWEKTIAIAVKARTMLLKNDGFGLNEVLGIAAALIIASMIIIPKLSGLAGEIMENLSDWWKDIAKNVISPEG